MAHNGLGQVLGELQLLDARAASSLRPAPAMQTDPERRHSPGARSPTLRPEAPLRATVAVAIERLTEARRTEDGPAERR